jgi:hypothetical protein
MTPKGSPMPEYVKSDEFTRFVVEQHDYRTRAETRLAVQHAEVMRLLQGILDEAKATNGRVRSTESALTGMGIRLDRIDEDAKEIEKTAKSIKEDGCSQYAAHVQILQGQSPDGWSTQKKVGIGGAIAGAGALAAELANIVKAWLQ